MQWVEGQKNKHIHGWMDAIAAQRKTYPVLVGRALLLRGWFVEPALCKTLATVVRRRFVWLARVVVWDLSIDARWVGSVLRRDSTIEQGAWILAVGELARTICTLRQYEFGHW